MDGIILGERVYKKMTDAWLEAAHVVFDLDGDKEALQEFRYAFGRNPSHIKKAVQRFPELWGEDAPDLFELLATIQLSKVKADGLAVEIFEEWTSKGELDYDDLKRMIADTQDPKPRAASLAARCAKHIYEKSIDEAHEAISDEPEIAKALARLEDNARVSHVSEA